MTTLVLIDLQPIFATGPWGTPRFGEIIAPTRRLARAVGAANTITTRWVPPAQPAGSWRDYFAQWPFARQPPDSPDLALVPEIGTLPSRTLSANTFGKWAALRAALDPAPGAHLIVGGVSTDCCVIATVLPAADAGMRVDVVTDLCAGSDDDNHAQALHVMSLFAPQVRLIDSASLLAELSHAGADG